MRFYRLVLARQDDRLHSHKRCEKRSATIAWREALLSNRKAGENEIAAGKKRAARKIAREKFPSRSIIGRAKIRQISKKSAARKSSGDENRPPEKNGPPRKIGMGKIGPARNSQLEKIRLAKKSSEDKNRPGDPKKSSPERVAAVKIGSGKISGRAKITIPEKSPGDENRHRECKTAGLQKQAGRLKEMRVSEKVTPAARPSSS